MRGVCECGEIWLKRKTRENRRTHSLGSASGVGRVQGVVRGGAGDRGRELGSLLSVVRYNAYGMNQARERVQGERWIPRPGLAMEAGVTVELREHPFALVAKQVEVVGLRKGVTVLLFSSSQHLLRRPIAGRPRASTVPEVQGDNPGVEWAGGAW